MTPIVLIQLGDVHFPDAGVNSLAIDFKDASAPRSLAYAIQPDRLRNSLRSVLREIEGRRSNIKGLLICGDLTSRGNLSGYAQCVKYLDGCLRLSDTTKWSQDEIHVVPGNHDVDRAQCDPKGVNLFSKFNPLAIEWSALHLPILATQQVRQTAVATTPTSVTVMSINSCVGCGEKRSLPQGIRDELSTLLQDYSTTQNLATAFSIVGETLDTPAFFEEDVEQLIAKIGSANTSTLPVILAHHNLLPQAMPRIEIYTEVINGGLVRTRLTECGRPIIYCHGHIHADPVELVVDPKRCGRLVSIAAPQLHEGFNVIELHFSRSHTPIGCRVIPYRTSPTHGGVSPGTPIRVPLQDARHVGEYMDPLTLAVARSVTDTFVDFQTLRKAVGERMGATPQTNSLAGAIDDLDWLGLTDVHNHQEEPRTWKIRRTHP